MISSKPKNKFLTKPDKLFIHNKLFILSVVLLVVLLFLTQIPLASAQATSVCGDGACAPGEGTICPSDCPSMLSQWFNWTKWAGIAILITSGLIAIGFMVSKVFAVPAWEAWIKEEFGNLLLTIFLLIMTAALIESIQTISNGIGVQILSTTGGTWTYSQSTGRWNAINIQASSCPAPCHFYIARGFLGKLYEDYASSLKEILIYYSTSRFEESESFGFGVEYEPSIVNLEIEIPVFAGKAIFNNSLESIVINLMNAMQVIKFQEFALYYIQGLCPVLIMLGLILRIIPQLRPLGGLLFSLGFGLYIFFPMIYDLSWYVVSSANISLEVGSGTLTDYSPHITDVLSDDPAIFYTTWDNAGRPTKIGLFDAISRVYVPKFLIPVLAIFITIGFVRHFSPMIGGDPEIAGLSKLI